MLCGFEFRPLVAAFPATGLKCQFGGGSDNVDDDADADAADDENDHDDDGDDGDDGDDDDEGDDDESDDPTHTSSKDVHLLRTHLSYLGPLAQTQRPRKTAAQKHTKYPTQQQTMDYG